MGLDLMREARARIEKVNLHAIEVGTILIYEFMKGTFVAGLRDDRIKYLVKAKEEENSLAQLIETALQGESEVNLQKFKGNQSTTSLTWPNAGNHGGLRRDYRPEMKREVNAITSMQCFRCQRAGPLAENCRNKSTYGTCHKVGHVTKDCRAKGSQGNGQ
jgi:hypothetical protein